MCTRVPFRLVLAALATAVALACDDSTTLPASPSATAPLPDGTSAVVAGAVPKSSPMAAGHGQRAIMIFDACDPETFNAELGPNTCVRNGGVRFANFIELLTRNRSVGAWHFTPPQAQMNVGDVLVAMNQGGETHTFTEVDEFGGGIVPMLNELSGQTTVAPECNQLAPADFIRAGASTSETEDEEGVEKYQCCIHPWMRMELQVGKH